MPCKRCEVRGWTCSAKQKTMSSKTKRTQAQVIAFRHSISKFSISKPMSNDIHDIIPSFDCHYLQFLATCTIFPSQYNIVSTPHYRWVSLFARDTPVAGPTFRAAALVFASYMKHRKDHYHTWKCNEAFCISAKKACHNGDLMDLLCIVHSGGIPHDISGERPRGVCPLSSVLSRSRRINNRHLSLYRGIGMDNVCLVVSHSNYLSLRATLFRMW